MKHEQDFIQLFNQQQQSEEDKNDIWLLTQCTKALDLYFSNNITTPASSSYHSLSSFIVSSSEEEEEEEASRSSNDIMKAIQALDNTITLSSPSVLQSKPQPRHNNRVQQQQQQLTTNNQRPLSMPIQLPSFRFVSQQSPDYEDNSLIKRINRCRSMVILPREEEGKEELPAYSCTVYKMGYVTIKKEFDAPLTKTRRRSWRKYYVELWGTVLRIYRASPEDINTWRVSSVFRSLLPPLDYYYTKYYYTPIATCSLAGAEASRALDYVRKPNVLRLTINQGPQLLIRLPCHVEMISWIEHLQAAINISLDLESRPMPKFVTMPTRNVMTEGILDPRTIEQERLREQRRREQREILI
ncbi:MAG: hypothetical protein EXX96DRAFT_542547 [Benjaminiella poitrasii]|nr:MAG: hypothetical protein EXX96DRAFT_542547 [Benjaminiella poitrasii]